MKEKICIGIIGGSGFVGYNLTLKLLNLNYKVYILDLNSPQITLFPSLLNNNNNNNNNKENNYHFKKVNISNYNELNEIFKECSFDIIIHLASWGMSGSAMLSKQCYVINIEGTKNIITLCSLYNIKGLIYTSTYNVIFGGQEIINGDENMSYYPIDSQPDCYGPSKTMAEKLVIDANGTKTSNNSTLITCSIRPAAIYGPDEIRHFPRIVNIMDSGLFLFLIGSATVDWVHIDNLVSAYISATNLIAHSNSKNLPILSGQKYFISDGTPINQNEFLRPLSNARGVPFPTLNLSPKFMKIIAYILEKIHILGRETSLYSIEPFFTRSEVNKVAVTHYFSIEKAKKELNYHPTITSKEGAEEMGKKYRDTISNKMFFRFTPFYLQILILFGMYLTGLFALESVDLSGNSKDIFQPLRSFSYLIFRTQQNLKILFILAVLAHFTEALVAISVCRELKCDFERTIYWFIQTFLYGYGSLGLLYERKEFMKSISKKS